MKILLDNGHGYNTPGKCSPDKRFREYKYNRIISKKVYDSLKAKGFDIELIVPEEVDISLGERARRVNSQCTKLGTSNVCLVSIHCNAAGNGKWMNAEGWSIWTSKGQTKGDKLADEIYKIAAKTFPTKGRRVISDFKDGDGDYESNFYILAKTKCAACLIENFFMDDKEDLAYLETEAAKDTITQVIVEGIINYVNKYK